MYLGCNIYNNLLQPSLVLVFYFFVKPQLFVTMVKAKKLVSETEFKRFPSGVSVCI